jgi:hypothetical protein
MSRSVSSQGLSAPSTASLETKAAERLSTGNDSNVFRFGDWVGKEYQRLTFDEVARYVELQNGAGDVLRRLAYKAPILIRGISHTLEATEAVPVETLGLSASGLPMTLSRFVQGPNLERLMFRPERLVKYANEQIDNPAVRKFAVEMNALFWDEYPTRVQDEFHYHLCMLSRLLDRELGVNGLYIGKYNAKVLPVLGEPRINLVITDIAVYIDRVEFPGREVTP